MGSMTCITKALHLDIQMTASVYSQQNDMTTAQHLTHHFCLYLAPWETLTALAGA